MTKLIPLFIASVFSFASSLSLACKQTADEAYRAHRNAVYKKIADDPKWLNYSITNFTHKSNVFRVVLVNKEDGIDAHSLSFKVSSQADCTVNIQQF